MLWQVCLSFFARHTKNAPVTRFLVVTDMAVIRVRQIREKMDMPEENIETTAISGENRI